MHAGCCEWRRERFKHLLCQGPRLWLFFIGYSEESITHPHVEFSRTRHLQSQFMKRPAAGARIESEIVRAIADEVITLLIFHHALDAAAQIIRVLDSHAAGLLRQKVETRLRLKGCVSATAHRVH